MVIIGISGNPGSGKTTLSEILLKDYNTKVIALDKLFNVIKEKLPNFLVTKSVRDNGDESLFLSRNGFYNMIKNNPTFKEEYFKLRRLLGKKILENEIEKASEEYDFLIIEGVPLLDYGRNTFFDYLIRIDASYDIRESRVKKRNSKEELKNNNPMDTFVEPYAADYYIVNNGSLEELYENAHHIEESILEKCKGSR